MTRLPPLTLRVSVTDRCDLRCVYCSPGGSAPRVPRDEILSFDEIIEVVRILRLRFDLLKVRITGGEPLMRPGVARLVAMLAREGVPDLALTTNAQRLAGHARDLRAAGLHRVNVSLDSLDAGRYREMTGGDLSRALSGIDAARAEGLAPIKLNMVVLKGLNEGELVELVRFARGRDCRARFLELMPIGPTASLFDDLFVPASEILRRLGEHFDVRALPPRPGSSSRDYRLTDRAGRSGVIGVIAPCSAPFCDACRRLRLTARGELLGCLAHGDGIELRSILRGPCARREERVLAAAVEALGRKQGARRFTRRRGMAAVGG